MKKIGFADFYLSEWHANNYPAWIEKANEALGLDYKVAYAWAEVDVSPVDGRTTDEWCRAFGAEKCASLAELCEKSDVILLLAPSDPEKHLEYAKTVLPFGKRTYIDKTFAPTLREAEEIFALAEEHNAPFFSSSALRYSAAVGQVAGLPLLTSMGGGRSVEEYVVHQAEMLIAATKKTPAAVRATGMGAQLFATIRWKEGGEASLLFSPALDFCLLGEDEGGAHHRAPAGGDFFPALLRDILRFFETGEVSFDPRETLAVMQLREMILAAKNTPDEWILA